MAIEKCVGPDGKIIYTDLGCPKTTKRGDIKSNFSTYRASTEDRPGYGSLERKKIEIINKLKNPGISASEFTSYQHALSALNGMPKHLQNTKDVLDAVSRATDMNNDASQRTRALYMLKAYSGQQ